MTRSEERKQFLEDILVGIVEDYGYNQWREIDEFSYGEGRAVIIEVDDGNMQEFYAVTLDILSHGLGKLLRNEIKMNTRLLNTIKESNRDNDAGNIDAELADIILQAALFGEIVYG